MKQAVFKRLGYLEERRAAALHAGRSAEVGERARRWFEQLMRLLNAVPWRHESKMDAVARCLGLRSWEMRDLLRGNVPEFKRVVLVALERKQQSERTG